MDIAQILRSQGFKVTPQRIAIYDALRGHHDHPTAEMLYHTWQPCTRRWRFLKKSVL